MNPLGNSGVGHDTLFSITVPFGSYMEASLTAHIFLGLGAVFVVS